MPAHRLAPHYKRSTGPFMGVRPPHWALLAQSESQIKKAADLILAAFFCSSSWARTKDPLINSQML